MKPPLLFLLAVLAGFAVSPSFTQKGARAPFALTAVPAHAQARAAAVQVRVAPDHLDWNCRIGELAKFVLGVTADNEPLSGATVRDRIGPEMIPAGGLVIDAGTLAEPGILRCAVTFELNGKTYRGLATASFSPEKICPTRTEPADIEAFWQAGKEEVAKVPLEPPNAAARRVHRHGEPLSGQFHQVRYMGQELRTVLRCSQIASA